MSSVFVIAKRGVKLCKGKTVLDIGYGTGIQAITAALNGAKKVVAVDINPLAIKLTKENAELNKVKIEVYEGDCFITLRTNSI